MTLVADKRLAAFAAILEPMRILVTAFDAFGGEEINPTEQALAHLPNEIGGAQISKRVVPTVFGKSLEKVISAAEEEQVDAVVCLGQAGGRAHITPELIGINLADATIADNAGARPQDEPVVVGGPAAYFSTLPVKKMVAAIAASGATAADEGVEIPAELSTTAGTFVCNQLLYGLLHHFAGTPVKAGFIHVPFSAEQNKKNYPMLELAQIVTGIERALAAVVEDASQQ